MTTNWELAGLTDSSGALGRPIPAGRVLVPGSISVVDDAIRWAHDGKSRLATPDGTMLNSFVRLWDERPAEIATFARRWGVLAIHSRGMPCAEGATKGLDPVSAWRFYSRRSLAVLNLVAATRQQKLGAVEDWQEIGALSRSGEEIARAVGRAQAFPLPQRMGMPETTDQARVALTNEVNAWMAVWRKERLQPVSDFRLDVNESGDWSLEIDFHGFLFSAIAFQLCLVAANSDSLFCCSGCAYTYARRRELRRPRPGQGNYCASCVKAGVPVRRASERYRQRKEDGKKKRR